MKVNERDAFSVKDDVTISENHRFHVNNIICRRMRELGVYYPISHDDRMNRHKTHIPHQPWCDIREYDQEIGYIPE